MLRKNIQKQNQYSKILSRYDFDHKIGFLNVLLLLLPMSLLFYIFIRIKKKYFSNIIKCFKTKARKEQVTTSTTTAKIQY